MEYLFLSIVIGFCSAQLTRVLDFSFNEGNILDWYYVLLLKYIEPISIKLAKPLGTCIKCFSVWVCFFVFGMFLIFTNIPWYYIFLSQGISAYIIYRNQKTIKNLVIDVSNILDYDDLHLNSDKNVKEFIKIMSEQDKETQELFTEFCFKWIEHGSENEKNDLIKIVCKHFVDSFKDKKPSKPSDYFRELSYMYRGDNPFL